MVANSPNPSPFHLGERMLQEKAGVRDRLEAIGQKTIRRFMPDQHRELFSRLPYLLVGALDAQRHPRATLLVGRPGFVTSPNPTTLRIDARPVQEDPLAGALANGVAVGLLGIELATRRRNRMNGTVIGVDDRGFSVRVAQSFGNCPKYIQARTPVFLDPPSWRRRQPRAEGQILSATAAGLIATADTFFIATAAARVDDGEPAHGVDVSHRGGLPGFVRVTVEEGRTVLTIPDFAGNLHFNTFGNLAVNPRAGLLFVDFATGGVLSLAGHAEVMWSGVERDAFIGAERLLRFTVAEGIWIPDRVPLRWSEPGLSPHLAATGTWADVG